MSTLSQNYENYKNNLQKQEVIQNVSKNIDQELKDSMNKLLEAIIQEYDIKYLNDVNIRNLSISFNSSEDANTISDGLPDILYFKDDKLNIRYTFFIKRLRHRDIKIILEYNYIHYEQLIQFLLKKEEENNA